MSEGHIKLDGDPPAEPVHRQLEIDQGDGKRQRVALVGQRMILGRASDAQIKLESPGVSRHHAELFCDPFGRWWVRDLGSRNGTWVNGFTVTERVLEPADQLQVGECVMRMVLPESGTLAVPAVFAQHDVRVTESSGGRISTLNERSGHKIAAQHLSTLMAFGEQLQSVENPAERMRLLCMLMVRREFHGQAAVVLRLRRDDPEAKPRALCTPQWGAEVKEQSLYISRTLLKALLEQARPLVASNVSGQNADVELSDAQASMAAVACPLRGQAQGQDQELDVFYLLLPPAYGTDEWLALATLAAEHYRQAELAWSARRQAKVNALIEHDLERAREIQMRLVPQNPQVAGLDVAISYRPCRWIGGDYADIVPLPGNRTLLLIADVCGKGLPAALISSSVHTMVRVCVRAGMPLVQIANLLNEHLHEYLPANRFVTGMMIELDPATGKMQFINAGHPPPLIVGPGVEPRRMEVTAHPPFGLKNVNYETKADQLDHGQWLAMYTDGLTEMRDDAGHMLAIERLGDHVRMLVTASPTAPARELATQLAEALDRYQGNRMPADDRTFLVARRV